jgi:hypothetical protein
LTKHQKLHFLQLLRRGPLHLRDRDGHGFELASLNKTNLVMREEDVLVPVTAITLGWEDRAIRF